jgi:hypothetical protein
MRITGVFFSRSTRQNFEFPFLDQPLQQSSCGSELNSSYSLRPFTTMASSTNETSQHERHRQALLRSALMRRLAIPQAIDAGGKCFPKWKFIL